MTAPFLSPGFRATDSDDNPLAGGYISFYAAGTTTPKAVYSDADLSTSLGTSVDLNSAGAPVSGGNTPVLIYPGLGDYKIRYYDANDALIFEFDDYPGGVAEAEESTTGLPVIPVDSKTTAYTVVEGDRANLINCNPTGGSFAITLPSAVTVGDDFLVGFKHNGTANAVTIVATGSQVIRFQGNRAAFSLVGQGEVMWLVSDGSDWNCCGYVPPFRKATDPYFIVADRLTAPPANPDAGARYLINGTPTGAWSTLGFADEDIAEADGNGSWIKHTPAEGWLAFDADEKVSLVFKDGAWENFQIDPGESTLKTLIVQDQKSSGTVGGTATATTWTTAVLNTSVVNTIDDSSLAANTITLPAGRYRVRASKVFVQTEASRIRFKTATGSSVLIYSNVVLAGYLDGTVTNNARAGATAVLEGEFEIAVSTDFILQYYVAQTVDTEDLGLASSASGVVEVYATVVIEDLAAQQGPTGAQGDPGEDGLDGVYAYQFNTATSGDPGSGKILLNNATPASATEIAVSTTDANAADLTAVIATWDNSTSTTSKARLRFVKSGASENFMEFLITGAGTDEGDYWTFPVSYVANGGTVANGNDIALLVIQTGDIGDPGTTVPDIDGLTELAITEFNRRLDAMIVYDASAASHKKFFIPMMGVDVTHPTFGATGDGVTDDTTAIQDAVDYLASLGGGRLTFPPGTYVISDAIAITTSNIHIEGTGAFIDATAVPVAAAFNTECAFSVSGSIGTGIAVSNDIALGAKQITVADTTTLAAGDLILLRSANEEYPVGATVDPGNSRKGALHYIRSIDSGTLLTLMDGSFFAYESDDTVTVKKITPVSNVTIEGLDIEMGGEDTAHCGIIVWYGVDCWLRDVKVRGGEDANARFNFCYGGGVDGGFYRDATSPDAGSSGVTTTTGYGISVASGTRNLAVRGARFNNNRHSITGGGDTPVILCDIEFNTVDGSRALSDDGYDIECHEECPWWTFRGNKISGSLDTTGSGGLMVRGAGCVVENNHIINAWQYAILVQCFDDNPNGIDGVKIIGNTIEGARLIGISVLGSVTNPAKNIEIIGNTVRGVSGNGDGIRLSVTTGALISGNNIVGMGGTSSGIRLLGSATTDDHCEDIVIGPNRIDTVGGYGYRFQYVERLSVSNPHIRGVTSAGISYENCQDVAQDGGYVLAPSGTVSPVVLSSSSRVAINGGVLEAAGSPSSNAGVLASGTYNDLTVNGVIVNNCQYPVRATGTVNYVACVGVNGRNCAAAIDIVAATNRLIYDFADLHIPSAAARAATADLRTWYVLAASAVAATTLTGGTSEVVAATIAVPANAIGPNGVVRITTVWSATSGGAPGTRTTRIRFGASGAGTGASTLTASANVNTVLGAQIYTKFHNANSTSSQKGFTSTGIGFQTTTGTVPITIAIDTTAATDIVITGQLANGGDSLTLESYLVEVLYLS